MSRSIWLHVFYTIAVSIILNLVVFFIGQAAGVSFATEQGIVEPIFVIFASAAGAVIGCVGYWLLGLIFGDSQRIWFIWLATIIGVISMWGPWTMSSDLATMGFLGLMHVVSVLVMTWYLGVWTPHFVAADEIALSSS